MKNAVITFLGALGLLSGAPALAQGDGAGASQGALLAEAAPAEEEASQIDLPHSMKWCQPRSEVVSLMSDPQDVAGDVIESKINLWKLDGFVTAEFESERLVTVRVRFFWTEASAAKVKKELEKGLGPGADDGRKTTWSLPDGQNVTMRVQSEQIYVTWEIAWDSCEGGNRVPTGPSEQEKADAEAARNKPAIDWDPYADQDDEAPIVDKKKKEEEKKEEKKEEETPTPAVKDGDIDW